MGFSHHLMITALVVFALVTMVEHSTSHVLKGSVSCLDCSTTDQDLSEIRVSVKCSKVKKLATAITAEDGTFQTDLPSDDSTLTPTSPFNCITKILGGPTQLYVSKRNMVHEISKVPSESNFYTISTPLMFYTSCPLSKNDAKSGGKYAAIGSSKTVDLPPEWGLAPSTYYIPFIPIIGIP